jgi:outer membrane protein OmpA-like peptidoglycan-associated protein
VHDGGAAATTTKSDVAPKGGDATGMEPAESDNEANAAIPPVKQSSAADNITLATDAVVHGRPAAPKSGEENRDGNVMAGGGGFPFAADHEQSHDKPDGNDYSKINGDRKIAVKTWQVAIAKPKSPSAGPPASGRKNSRLAAKPILKSGECQEVFNSELISGTIMFEKRSAELRHGIEPLLHRLADVALRCPKTKIEIAGHTDSDGSDNFNRFLSLRRAETVVDFLVKAGVARNRLFAIGYGEDEPRVPNTSIRNKAKNRRIEFVVRG